MSPKSVFLTLLIILSCIIYLPSITHAQNNTNTQNTTTNTTTYLHLPEKTTMQIINIDNLDSKTNHKYDLINFRLHQDLVVNNEIILPKDTKLQGMITKIHGSRLLVESAIIRIKLNNITLADGSILEFPCDLKLKGGKNYANIASSIIVPFSGLLFKGKEVSCPSGSIIEYSFEG